MLLKIKLRLFHFLLICFYKRVSRPQKKEEAKRDRVELETSTILLPLQWVFEDTMLIFRFVCRRRAAAAAVAQPQERFNKRQSKSAHSSSFDSRAQVIVGSICICCMWSTQKKTFKSLIWIAYSSSVRLSTNYFSNFQVFKFSPHSDSSSAVARCKVERSELSADREFDSAVDHSLNLLIYYSHFFGMHIAR